jgi:DNA primase
MISQQTINAVKDRMDIFDIVSQHVKLQKHGANFLGLCPFHAEKTGSFTVSSAKQIYKCFGCGKSGDAIKFIQEHEKKDFPEAIVSLAQHYNIPVEYREETEEQKKQREQTVDQKQLLRSAVSFALQKYQTLLTNTPQQNGEAWKYLIERDITEEAAQFWGLGHAPDLWHFISAGMIENNFYQPALDAGLIKTKDGKAFDFYRARIIIPIHDHRGDLAGIAGRLLPPSFSGSEQQTAKYLNPQESVLYNKSKILFGLHQAILAKAFNKTDGAPAYLCEGYFDVISMHEEGIQTAVATCGTALTEDQIKLLKRYTNHVVVLRDKDAAGNKAAMKDIDLLLHSRMITEVVEVPEGKDIDEYIRIKKAKGKSKKENK